MAKLQLWPPSCSQIYDEMLLQGSNQQQFKAKQDGSFCSSDSASRRTLYQHH